MLSHGFWRRQFGGDRVRRRPRHHARRRALHRSSASCRGRFRRSFVDADLWTPLGITTTSAADDSRTYIVPVAELAGGATIAQADAEIASHRRRSRQGAPADAPGLLGRRDRLSRVAIRGFQSATCHPVPRRHGADVDGLVQRGKPDAGECHVPARRTRACDGRWARPDGPSRAWFSSRSGSSISSAPPVRSCWERGCFRRSSGLRPQRPPCLAMWEWTGAWRCMRSDAPGWRRLSAGIVPAMYAAESSAASSASSPRATGTRQRQRWRTALLAVQIALSVALLVVRRAARASARAHVGDGAGLRRHADADGATSFAALALHECCRSRRSDRANSRRCRPHSGRGGVPRRPRTSSSRASRTRRWSKSRTGRRRPARRTPCNGVV